ncbi:MATE family efflux transporter [Calothrix rhizosoleniae]|uniref:MATE family efflux transporter n=1 Tax=Calothrix rhizosoleniae TaxID=888997 RepID=UPI000B49776E|nr:MATE family efflux transporter [Calothrix rhizosoleniae]
MRQQLTEGNVGSHLVKLTLPMMGGIFALVAFNVADTYFVGQLGAKHLAAMSFTFPVVMTLGSLAMGLGVGASSIIARAIGEGQHTRVQRFTTNSLILSVLAVGIFVTLGLFTIDPLFTALGADADILPLIRDYMQIWYFGMIFLVVPMVGNSAIRSAGNTTTPSLIMTIAAGINIVLDPLLILGWAGFPQLGIQGAALATLISRATTLVASLLVLHFQEKMLCLQIPRLQETLWCWKEILYVGLPAAGTSMINPISIGIITSLLASFGAESVAAFGIASRVESFSLLTLMALSVSIAPFVGQNWGAKKYTRVTMALKLSFLFCLFWGVAVALVLVPTASWLVAKFNTDTNIVSIATLYLWIVPISYGAAGVILVTNSAFNALGKPIPSIVMSVMRGFVLYIPLAYLGGNLVGVQGIFIATSIANLVVGVGAYVWNQQNCSIRAILAAEQAST